MEARHAHASRKRKLRNVDDEAWDCSVCTYKNSPGAFRCEMCQTRKGTSTRKPKLNPQIVEEQSFIARAIIKEREEEQGLRKRREARSGGGGTAIATGGGGTGANSGAGGGGMLKGAAATTAHALLPSLCNVDRSSPLLFEIFANGYSVVITEYQPKVTAARSSTSVADSPVPSNSSSLLGFTSTPLGVNSGQMSPAEQPQPSTRAGCQFADFPEVDDSFGYGTASRSAIGSRPMNPSPSSCETGAGEETEGVHVKSDQPPPPSRRSNFTHHSMAPASTADLKPFTFSASSSTSSASSTSSSVPYPTPPQEDRLHECPLPATEGSGKTEALVTPKPSGGHPKSDVQMAPAPVNSCPSTFRGTKGRLKRRLPHSISDATDSASIPAEQAQEGEADVKAAPSWTARSRTKQRRFSTPKSLHVSPSFSRVVSPRSLRSHLGSNTRQASRVARASLYQNTDQLRPPRAAHKRRKLLGSSLSGAASARRSAAGSGGPQKNTPAKSQPSSTPPSSASPKAAKQEEEEPSVLPTAACQSTAVSAETGEEVSKDLAPSATATVVITAAATTTSKTITVNGCPSTESSKNTTAMTDSCGALTLEMSAV